ncbi:2,4-dienoyl-CoA reductase-like NADH-dependent reductase (Old Yellow Enzyme family) [Prauserella sediminis]|uniref:2,4-dienoyl-CoA reductase-like NADH-dependent reductase (Old Yellow Enzyme family) n=1 Tax=Prauserella sediminis TaxID=577680 RepID=A0A839XLF1_9PSEU|nr:NADH:flavin oxidoreductase/NADH oxidase family protein [Prauserella sediminis]MBB3663571.1 2,4-dienoyl-CoA reductase-like NADH-dependent reductase (Old Yellow Enzyme family) [Prauserella sediminis]
MTGTTPLLARTLTLPNGARLGNRLAKAAMSECLGDLELAPTEGHVRLYRRWARSGAGLLITGNIMVERTAIGEVGNVVVDDERDMGLLRRWASAGKEHGAHVWAQLNHPGRQIPVTLNARPVAPSEVPVANTAGLFRSPRELTHGEVETLVTKFATTAGILVRAGFTGIEIHAAHGYLISQFLSPATNRRTDAWGGDRDRRRRFLIEIVRAVRAEIGEVVPLAVKLNSADFQRGGFDQFESAAVVSALADEGIDLLEISGGTYESTAFMGLPAEPVKASSEEREAYFLDFAQRIRQQVSLPLLLTGGFRTTTGIADAIGSDEIDVAGLARPLALEPDLPARMLDGTSTASTVRHRTLGIRRLDGASDLLWHTTQLWRMADGKDPAPGRHPLITMAHYFSRLAPYTLHRIVRGTRSTSRDGYVVRTRGPAEH